VKGGPSLVMGHSVTLLRTRNLWRSKTNRQIFS